MHGRGVCAAVGATWRLQASLYCLAGRPTSTAAAHAARLVQTLHRAPGDPGLHSQTSQRCAPPILADQNVAECNNQCVGFGQGVFGAQCCPSTAGAGTANPICGTGAPSCDATTGLCACDEGKLDCLPACRWPLGCALQEHKPTHACSDVHAHAPHSIVPTRFPRSELVCLQRRVRGRRAGRRRPGVLRYARHLRYRGAFLRGESAGPDWPHQVQRHKL